MAKDSKITHFSGFEMASILSQEDWPKLIINEDHFFNGNIEDTQLSCVYFSLNPFRQKRLPATTL
jgi:hypothetical protein